MPEGFEIDHKTKLNGLISNYAQQVLICTGKSDWPSKIEEDNSGDNLVADLKELVGGRGAVFSDVSWAKGRARRVVDISALTVSPRARSPSTTSRS